ncbi:hypothetical protein EL22_28110 [Halostagnicola sp. A56]|nr:hypothetical protein EL22_28110 [Halostagnicola sp. A56]
MNVQTRHTSSVDHAIARLFIDFSSSKRFLLMSGMDSQCGNASAVDQPDMDPNRTDLGKQDGDLTNIGVAVTDSYDPLGRGAVSSPSVAPKSVLIRHSIRCSGK